MTLTSGWSPGTVWRHVPDDRRMSHRLTGRNIVISGGATGAGGAVAERFAVEGARISTTTDARYGDIQIASRIMIQAEGVAKAEISEFLQTAFNGLKNFR